MGPEVLRNRIQAVLLQDFDAVRDEFVIESGNDDPRALLEHLREWSLVPDEVIDQVLRELDAPPPPPPAPAPARPLAPIPNGWEDDDDSDPDGATVRFDGWRDDDTGEETRIGDADELRAADLDSEEQDAPEEPPSDEVDVEAPGWTEEVEDDSEEATRIHTETSEELPAGADNPLLRVDEDTAEVEPPRPAAEPTPALSVQPSPKESPEGARRLRFRKGTGGRLRQTGGWDDDARGATGPTTGPSDPSGRYTFVGTVGEGAMGRVHLAEDRTLRRRVAYKEMSADIRARPKMAVRFVTEARITAQLDHPGIVPVYALEGDGAYTMKLVEGRTLAGLVAEARAAREAGRPVPDEVRRDRMLERFARLCDTVAYAHARGVVHRDLKPENVMVGAFGEVYVMDWGIARVVDPSVERPVVVDQIEDEGDLVIGTPGYMSPEQALGENDRLGPASDQYALGLMLFELLALKPAVSGKNPTALVTRNQEGEKDPLRHAYGDRIPRELAAIVRKATAPDGAARYRSVADLAEDIRRFLRGEPVTAKPDNPIQRTARWLSKHREWTLFLMLALAAGTVLTAAIGVGFAQWQSSRSRLREEQLSAVLTEAARQASHAEGRLLELQGLLAVVSTATAEALNAGAGPQPAAIAFAPDFADGPTAPADAREVDAQSRFGATRVSLAQPVVVLAPGVARESVEATLQALVPRLARHLPQVVLRSRGEVRPGVAAELVRRIVVEGDPPVGWAWVALEPGVLVSWPGQGGWPEGHDARKGPAWLRSAGDPLPRWGAIGVHPTGNGSVVTVSQAVLDDGGHPLAVSGLDVSLDWMLDELLLPEPYEGLDGVEGFLLDSEGRVVVRTSLAGRQLRSAISGRTLRTPEFEVPEVVTAVKAGRSGHLESDGRLIVFHHLSTGGWTHVVSGPTDALLRAR